MGPTMIPVPSQGSSRVPFGWGPLGGVGSLGIKSSVTTLTGREWQLVMVASSIVFHSKIFVTLQFCHLHLAWVGCDSDNVFLDRTPTFLVSDIVELLFREKVFDDWFDF